MDKNIRELQDQNTQTMKQQKEAIQQTIQQVQSQQKQHSNRKQYYTQKDDSDYQDSEDQQIIEEQMDFSYTEESSDNQILEEDVQQDKNIEKFVPTEINSELYLDILTKFKNNNQYFDIISYGIGSIVQLVQQSKQFSGYDIIEINNMKELKQILNQQIKEKSLIIFQTNQLEKIKEFYMEKDNFNFKYYLVHLFYSQKEKEKLFEYQQENPLVYCYNINTFNIDCKFVDNQILNFQIEREEQDLLIQLVKYQCLHIRQNGKQLKTIKSFYILSFKEKGAKYISLSDISSYLFDQYQIIIPQQQIKSYMKTFLSAFDGQKEKQIIEEKNDSYGFLGQLDDIQAILEQIDKMEQ